MRARSPVLASGRISRSLALTRALVALQIAAILVVLYVALNIASRPWNNDAAGIYQAVRGDLYAMPWLDHGAYVYSPVFAQAITLLTALPWEAFWAIWVGLQVAILLVVARPIPAALLLVLPWFPFAGHPNPVHGTIANGNPQLFMAGAIVLAYRYPVAWAMPLLMKVTPGIGLVWYAARREWRSLAIAIGATLAIAAISVAFTPGLWAQWFGVLRQATAADAHAVEIIYVPLFIRLPVAAALIFWGARNDRYWTVPIGAMLALPAIAHGGFALAVAAIPFLRPSAIRTFDLFVDRVSRLWSVTLPSAIPASHPELSVEGERGIEAGVDHK
jgi:hypothetical protein